MPNVAIEYTDPANGAEGVYPQTIAVAGAKALRRAATQLATLMKSPRLEVYTAQAYRAVLPTSLLDPAGRHYASSALITFPAIYKPYRPGDGGAVKYPPMRVYPPVSVS